MNKKNINLSASEKLELISNLGTMLSAGISILEIVESLSEDSKGNQKKLLDELRSDLTQGNPISFSFAKFPKVFDSVTVNIIKAAEETGTLDITLKDITENIKRETEFKDKIKGALIYPIIIMIVFVGVLALILFFVIPKISVIFVELGADLPFATRILVMLSNFLIANTLPVFAGSALFFTVVILLYIKNKKAVLSVIFMLPLISTLGRQMDLTRFTRSMALLLDAGIPITSSLDLAQGTVFKKDISNGIAHTKKVVLSGNKLSKGLRDAKKTFPSIMIKIIEAGEKSGTLEKSMQDVSTYLDYQVSNTLKTVTTLIEPIMIVVVGVVVGGLMLAVIAPIYGIVSEIGL